MVSGARRDPNAANRQLHVNSWDITPGCTQHGSLDNQTPIPDRPEHGGKSASTGQAKERGRSESDTGTNKVVRTAWNSLFTVHFRRSGEDENQQQHPPLSNRLLIEKNLSRSLSGLPSSPRRRPRPRLRPRLLARWGPSLFAAVCWFFFFFCCSFWLGVCVRSADWLLSGTHRAGR